MYDILVKADIVFLDEYRVIRNGYVYLRNGLTESIGSQPVPEEYEYASLIIGGRNRVIAPSLGIAYTDIGLLDVHPSRRGFMEKRFELLEKIDSSRLRMNMSKALFDLSIKGVGVVGVELPSYSPKLELEKSTGIKIVPITGKCGGRSECVRPSYLESYPEGDVYLDSMESYVFKQDLMAATFLGRMNYNICSMSPSELLSSSRIAYSYLGRRWGLKEGEPALLAVYNFDEPPYYLANKSIRDIADLLRACKPVETLVIGENIVVDGGEHLTLGKNSMSQ